MKLAAKFFTLEEQGHVIEAIRKAERSTSGEIRVHVESFCFGDPLKAAERVFRKLKMHETAERNGILFYIATASRKIAIVGDAGIHNKLGNEYWSKMVRELTAEFQVSRHASALARCIVECGERLAVHFPARTDDNNELSDTISFNK